MELRPSTDCSHAELAELFTAAYEQYFVPFKVDETAFGFMVDVWDIDLGGSLVAFDGGERIGLANLGRRDDRAWLGGVGLVPARRGQGLGTELTRALMDNARERGAEEMLLEVITENAPAIAVYEKLGFERTQELDVLSLPRATGGAAAEEVPLDAAVALVGGWRETPEPWQREDETVAHLAASEEAAPKALVSGDAVAIYRMGGPAVSLVQAAGGGPALGRLLAALRVLGPVSAVNYASDGVVATAMRAAGAEVQLRQFEMAARL